MASKLEVYIEQGKALAADEREIAALALQQVDESEKVEVDAAWEEPTRTRPADLVTGHIA